MLNTQHRIDLSANHLHNISRLTNCRRHYRTGKQSRRKSSNH